MRLSLWQQFSSNHIASDTVVGEFQSAESAQEASLKIRHIVEEAIQWCFQNREECYKLVEPTPVETHYALHYGFDWKQPIDWLTYGLKEQSITTFDRLVIVDPHHVDTWQTGHQFVNILGAMGAKVVRTVMEGVDPDDQSDTWMWLGLEVRCIAQTPDDAANIIKTITSIYEDKTQRLQNSYKIPWLIFHPKLANLTKGEIITLETNYLEDQKLIRSLIAEHPDLIGMELHELWGKTRSLAHEQWMWVGNCRREIDAYGVTAIQAENEIIIQDISFARIPIGLPAFIRYLEAAGGSNIRYRTYQHSGSGSDE